MLSEKLPPSRFFGLDIHKHYLVAIGVDPVGNLIYGPRKVNWTDLETWRNKTLAASDAVVIEMTTNTWQVYDDLLPHVHSVTVVHPPHIKSVTGAGDDRPHCRLQPGQAARQGPAGQHLDPARRRA